MLWSLPTFTTSFYVSCFLSFSYSGCLSNPTLFSSKVHSVVSMPGVNALLTLPPPSLHTRTHIACECNWYLLFELTVYPDQLSSGLCLNPPQSGLSWPPIQSSSVTSNFVRVPPLLPWLQCVIIVFIYLFVVCPLLEGRDRDHEGPFLYDFPVSGQFLVQGNDSNTLLNEWV